jgi:arsenite methyltransferase
MNTNVLKNAVKDGYGAIAKQRSGGLISKLFGCCDNAALAKTVSEKVGYSAEQIQEVPEHANMGLGCGNPLALARISAGDTVVDLGSGAGFDCFLASPLVGQGGKVIGVDMTDEMISLARKNKKKGGYANVSFVKGDIEQLPLPDNAADLIISNCVINLSTNKAQVFEEAYRVLKPGGEMSISDIVLLDELPDFIRNSVEGHIACIAGAEKLERYFDYAGAAGFRDVKIETKTTFPLELVLTDPIAQQIIKANALDDEQIREIASLITSITMSAKK